ncbi:hypothetical protein EV687_2596 [Corticibacter populi]|nr:hypothetical protein EV687_2596 [Corticibacter populi]
MSILVDPQHEPVVGSFPDSPAICILAEEGPLHVPFEAVRAYHGHAALAMLALTYQGLSGAIRCLEVAGRPVARADLDVLSGHPGPGVRDAFECVTRAVTRERYCVDTDLPWARHDPSRSRSYSFVLTAQMRHVRAILRPGVLPPRFFELLAGAPGKHAGEFSELKRSIACAALGQSPDALYDFRLGDDSILDFYNQPSIGQ